MIYVENIRTSPNVVYCALEFGMQITVTVATVLGTPTSIMWRKFACQSGNADVVKHWRNIAGPICLRAETVLLGTRFRGLI